MNKPFASHGDLQDKKITFSQLSEHAYAYEAESDPTSGVVIGSDSVAVIDARATPLEAQDLIAQVRQVTDKPIRYVILTHYHAVRTLGASAYDADHIICSEGTAAMIDERGEADFASEVGRFPRLFRGVDSIPGLTYPTITFEKRMTLSLGGVELRLEHIGRGHTRGDIVAYLPNERVLFAGDLVENGAAVYAGDAHIADWLDTLERIQAYDIDALVPGRGPALIGSEQINTAIGSTRSFLKVLYDSVEQAMKEGADLAAAYTAARRAMDPLFGNWPIYEHCIPFVVSRVFDELNGIDNPIVWTAERDREMWRQLQG